MGRLDFALLIAIGCCAQTVPTATVSGTVTDAITGIPMAGALVAARWKGGYLNTRTNANGHYLLANVPAGLVEVAAGRKDSHRPVQGRVKLKLVPGGFTIQEFALQAGSTIGGIISDFETGKPLRDCYVAVHQRAFAGGIVGLISDGFGETTRTDAKTGQFEIKDLDPGEYLLTILAFPYNGVNDGRCRGYRYYDNATRRDQATVVTITNPGDIRLNIRVKEAATNSIAGVVSLPASSESSMVRITLRGVDPDGPQSEVVLLQLPGPFRIENLAEGDYSLVITDWWQQPIRVSTENQPIRDVRVHKFVYERRIQIRREDLNELDIVLRPTVPVTVTGTVKAEDGSKLALNTHMTLSPIDAERLPYATALSGPFEITAIPGEYWLRLQPGPLQGYAVTHILAGTEDLLSSPLRVTDKPVSLTFVVSSRLGTVIGTAEGAALVLLFPEPIGPEIDSGWSRMANVDVDESFAFKDLPPGRYRPVILSQQDHLLARDPQFIRKAVDAAHAIEIKAGEITHVTLAR
jgi:hypothetical protein